MEDEKRAWRKRIELKKRSRVIKKRARRAEGATVRHARRFLVNRWDKIREVRLRIIFWLGGVGFLIALVGLQMVWFQKSYITQAAIGGGTYAEALQGPINTLNPLYSTTPAELAASQLLFSSLYNYDMSGHIHGDVATGMTDDGDKVYTVRLRHDVHWQDGQRLTANDIAYTVGLMKSPSVRAVQAASWQGIDAQVLDDYTIKFMLPAAYAPFPQALTFAIMPQHLLQSADITALRESAFSSAPVGSGPFKLRLLQVVNQTDGRKIVHLDANNTYYQGRPRLDHLQLHAYPDEESIGRALRTAEVSGASDITSDVAQTVDASRYDIAIHPQNNGVYALFNLNQPILKDPNVRKALQIGTDTKMIRNHTYGHPQALYLPFVSGQVPGADSIPEPAFDFFGAKQLLDSSGWVMRDGVRTKGADKLRLRVVTRKDADYEKALQILVGQWRQLGVQVDTQVYDTNNPSQSFTSDILQQRNYDVLLDELQIGGDPDVFAYWHSRGQQNFSNYANPVSDDALASARTRSDPQLRDVKYTTFAKQWLADVPAIGLYQSNFIYPHLKATHVIDPNEAIVNGDEHYAGVRYWTAEEGLVYKTP